MALDRKAHARRLHHVAAASGNGTADLARGDEAAACLDARAAPVLDTEAGDLAILNDVDAAPVGSAGIAPCHRIVADSAATPLHQSPHDGQARIVEIQERAFGAQLRGVKEFGIGAVEDHRVAAPPVGVALGVRMIDVVDAALADHRVVVEILLQPFPQLKREFVEGLVAVEEIVGPDDGGVAADIAAADPALFQNRDRGFAELAGQVIGCCKPVPAAADNDEIIGWLGRRVAPCRSPSTIARKALAQNPETGISPVQSHDTSRRALCPRLYLDTATILGSAQPSSGHQATFCCINRQSGGRRAVTPREEAAPACGRVSLPHRPGPASRWRSPRPWWCRGQAGNPARSRNSGTRRSCPSWRCCR